MRLLRKVYKLNRRRQRKRLTEVLTGSESGPGTFHHPDCFIVAGIGAAALPYCDQTQRILSRLLKAQENILRISARGFPVAARCSAHRLSLAERLTSKGTQPRRAL
jgi:hypothetical protein